MVGCVFNQSKIIVWYSLIWRCEVNKNTCSLHSLLICIAVLNMHSTYVVQSIWYCIQKSTHYRRKTSRLFVEKSQRFAINTREIYSTIHTRSLHIITYTITEHMYFARYLFWIHNSQPPTHIFTPPVKYLSFYLRSGKGTTKF